MVILQGKPLYIVIGPLHLQPNPPAFNSSSPKNPTYRQSFIQPTNIYQNPGEINTSVPLPKMTETTLSPDEAAAQQRASEQARLRKERREAKLKAGGSARLNKISGLAGGVPRGKKPLFI